MFKTIVSFIVCSATAYILYTDYENRKTFNNEFLVSKCIGDRKLINGIITSKPNNTDASFIMTYPEHISDPFFRIDTNYRNTIDYYDYSYVYPYDQMSYRPNNYFHVPCLQKKTLIYWTPQNNITYVSPSAKFNGLDIVLSNNSTVLYTNKKTQNKICEVITNQYIPNNQLVTILGTYREKYTGEKIRRFFEVELIGSNKDVINEIARKYYRISDTATIWGSLTFVVSAVVLTSSIL